MVDVNFYDFIREEGVVCETAGEVYFRCRLGWMRSVIYRGARELLLLQYIEVDVPGVELLNLTSCGTARVNTECTQNCGF